MIVTYDNGNVIMVHFEAAHRKDQRRNLSRKLKRVQRVRARLSGGRELIKHVYSNYCDVTECPPAPAT